MAAEAALPRVFSADPQVLVAAKASLADVNSPLKPAFEKLISEANHALAIKPTSVTDKNQVPPSGDKHDYISQAPYFWRDTNSPDGKYIRRDGERNPESGKDSDAGHFGQVCTATHTLGLAYYFTGEEKYAAKAAEINRVWFFNEATRMNPNLKYGQGIPGEVEGRPTGLIGARGLADLVDGVGLLAGSKSWTADDQKKMTAWVADYFHWLTTSPIGLGEDAASNNHGTFYDLQAVSLALFIGQADFAREKLLKAQTIRIANQIQPDGRMPRELGRTLSFSYSLFNLHADIGLATLGRAAGVDLWHYQTADGRSLQKAVDYMAPFVDEKKKWPYPQIRQANYNDLGDLLLRVSAEFPDDNIIQNALKSFPATDVAGNPERLYIKLGKPWSLN